MIPSKEYAYPCIQGSESSCLVDPIWESLDPSPNITVLFLSFNSQFFDNKLGSVEVRWSTRMTLCAGICKFEGKCGLCSISLSEPLLKFRPRKDLVETLLDRDGHGPNFQYHMNRINGLAGTKITIYHTFHDEVDNYRTHWWRCNGPCSQRQPFYGFVKRSMNRAPGSNDLWWNQHQLTCAGKFIKIKEPEKKIHPKNGKAVESKQCEKRSAGICLTRVILMFGMILVYI